MTNDPRPTDTGRRCPCPGCREQNAADAREQAELTAAMRIGRAA